MIGGRAAFKADSRAKLVAAILEHDPPPLPPRHASLDPQLEHIVSQCLRKDPDQRWQSAADIAVELQWLHTRPETDARRKAKPGLLLWLTSAVVLLVLASVTIVVQRLQRPAPPKVERRLSSLMVSATPHNMSTGRSFAVSPDRQTIAYLAGTPWRLFLRSSPDGKENEIPGTEVAIEPFFSPDGEWLGFSQAGKFKKLEVATGDVRTIADDGTEGRNFVHSAWGENDTIAFNVSGALYQVSASGGPVAELLKAKGSPFYTRASFLPGGQKVLFDTAARLATDPNDRTIAMLDLATKQVSVLIRGGSQPQYSPTGHLLFIRTDHPASRRATIFSVGFDLKSSRVTSAPVPRVSDVEASPPLIAGGRAHYAIGTDGSIYYVPHDSANLERELIWLDREGRARPATSRISPFANVAFSRDGTRIAFHDWGSIWVGDLVRDTWVQVATADYTQTPVWSPDGLAIAYEAIVNGKWGISLASADGGKPPAVLLEPNARVRPMSWSPDGRWIAFDKWGKTAEGIWVVEVKTGSSKQLATAPAIVPSFSPDGRWIAYVSIVPGGSHIIQVQPFPGPGPRSTIFTGTVCPPAVSCTKPQWSRDGRRLFFQADRKLMVVDVDSSKGTFRPGPAKVLFETEFEVASISPDGEKFLATRSKREPRWDHINVLSGWWAH